MVSREWEATVEEDEQLLFGLVYRLAPGAPFFFFFFFFF